MTGLIRAALSVFAMAAMTAATPLAAQAQRFPSEGFADLAERLSPAVVNIRTSQAIDGELPEFPMGSPLERFNDYLPDDPRTEGSLGSGFVIDPSGVVVTNNHVVEGADQIEIVFPDGLILDAAVVGLDPATDLAVLRVAHNEALPAVDFAHIDTARVGDWVVAIGNPFGLGNSVSVGVISARNRDIEAGPYDDFIQTDAAINRGNSGGPLFDLDGQVIGVNSAILSPTGGSVGIGFAIPAELAKTVVSQLLEFGETRRGYLGVNIQRVNRAIADDFGLDRPRGALVSRVNPGSPAAAAGLRPDDLILSYDGRPIDDDRSLSRAVADSVVGSRVRIEFLRGRERLNADVVIERLEEDGARRGPRPLPGPRNDAFETSLGVSLGALTEANRARYGVVSDARGVVVLSVRSGSDAFEKLQPGDVIEEVDWTRVETPDEAARLIDAATREGEDALLLVNKKGDLEHVKVKAMR